MLQYSLDYLKKNGEVVSETFINFNANPKGCRVGDCVKRALCVASQIDYNEIKRELNRYKKITHCEKFNNTKNWKPYVEKVLKGEKMSFPAIAGKPRMNGHTFAKTYKKGRYILRMSKHLVACVDGYIIDEWDSRDKCVYNAWKIKD